MKEIANCTFIREVLQSDKRVVVLFSSKLCWHCKTIEPVLKRIMKKTENINFFKIDAIENYNLAAQYSITYLPTVIVFEKGKVCGMVQGLKKEKKYTDVILS